MNALDALETKFQTVASEFLLGLPVSLARISDELATAAKNDQPLPAALLDVMDTIEKFGERFGFAELNSVGAALRSTLQHLFDQQTSIDDRICGAVQQYIESMACSAQSYLKELHEQSGAVIAALALSPRTNTHTWPRGVIVVSPHESHYLAFSEQLVPVGYAVEWLKHPDELKTIKTGDSPCVFAVHTEFIACINAALPSPGAVAAKGGAMVFFGTDDSMAVRLAALRAGGESFFHLPLNARSIIGQLDRLTGGASLPPDRVLIVDDSISVGVFFSEALKDAGLDTRNLQDPMRILEAIRDYSPDLIMVDLNMPGCDGIEVIRIIRQQDEWSGIPIVVVSGERSDAPFVRAMRFGATDFLRKPVSPDHLIERVIAHVERHRTLRMQMTKDGLTGLFNHARLNEAISTETKRAQRNGQPLSLAIIDLDKFKVINDTYGHQAGDVVLRNLSRLLVLRLRQTDIAGRYGGEEFCVLLPGTGVAAAELILDKLRREFASLTHRFGDISFQVTFSAGITEVDPDDDENSMFQRADKAMYRAKRDGRNEVRSGFAES